MNQQDLLCHAKFVHTFSGAATGAIVGLQQPYSIDPLKNEPSNAPIPSRAQ